MNHYRVSDESIKQDYHQWLCEKVDNDNQYNLLLMDMDKISFISLVPHDENRIQDGLVLRERYLEDSGWVNGESALNRECSILEMMIALAERMAFEMSTDDIDDQVKAKKYFWEMLWNLGIANCTDDKYVDLAGYYYVPEILNRFVNREIEFDGSGGIFPLKRPATDQRTQEIWNQMQAYLSERGEL